jgi:aspartyl-tRNA(Asn)/glutamyl-tRNA(Gln) amidotransferase subunit C
MGTMAEKISREEVRRVANLARLELDESEGMRITGQMNDLLSYMEELGKVDTTDVPPTTHAVQLRNVFRRDEVNPSLDRKRVLENAPQSDDASFVVPKIL